MYFANFFFFILEYLSYILKGFDYLYVWHFWLIKLGIINEDHQRRRNFVVSHYFRHIHVLQVIIPVYLYTCIFAYLCTCELVYKRMCVPLNLCTNV